MISLACIWLHAHSLYIYLYCLYVEVPAPFSDTRKCCHHNHLVGTLILVILQKHKGFPMLPPGPVLLVLIEGAFSFQTAISTTL